MDQDDSIIPGTVRVTLTQGKFAIIDEADAPKVLQYKWYAHHHKSSGLWYAGGPVINGKRAKLHHFVLPPPIGKVVDHKNRDGLDCRRDNLRIATRRQNSRNKIVNRGHAIGFKGVALRKKSYIARIQSDDGPVHIGCYATPEDAARAYDFYARKLFGEFALTNFSEVSELPNPIPERMSRSGFRGVYPHYGNFQVLININRKLKHLGCFSGEVEAAKAYDKEARTLGRKLNFPD